MSPPPKPSFVEATETEIIVEFKPAAATSYQLEWKEHSQDWATASQKTVSTATASSSCKATAEPLQPGTTYCVRLNDGTAAGPELVLDTEQVGCTPKQKKGCCTIQ